MINGLVIHFKGEWHQTFLSIFRLCLGALFIACFVCIVGNVKTETQQMEALQWMYFSSGVLMVGLPLLQIFYAQKTGRPLYIPEYIDGFLLIFALCVGSIGIANDSVISNNSSPVQATGATGPVSEPTSELSDTTISFIRVTNAISILFGSLTVLIVIVGFAVKVRSSNLQGAVAQPYVVHQPGPQYVVPGPQYVVQQPGPQPPVIVLPTMEQ